MANIVVPTSFVFGTRFFSTVLKRLVEIFSEPPTEGQLWPRGNMAQGAQVPG